MIEAWHFLKNDKRLRYGSNELVEVGKTIKIEGKPILCVNGLHASIRAIDALNYAPGSIITRVRLGGCIVEGDDKLVATERTIIWMADATEVLFEFSCWVAEEALKARQAEGYKFEQASFDAINASRRWLKNEITDRELSAAESAAESAARSAARSAAWSAAESAAESAARSAAWSAARSAAWSAAESAAESAARSAARSAAWSAARSAAWSAQNTELEKRLFKLGDSGE